MENTVGTVPDNNNLQIFKTGRNKTKILQCDPFSIFFNNFGNNIG